MSTSVSNRLPLVHLRHTRPGLEGAGHLREDPLHELRRLQAQVRCGAVRAPLRPPRACPVTDLCSGARDARGEMGCAPPCTGWMCLCCGAGSHLTQDSPGCSWRAPTSGKPQGVAGFCFLSPPARAGAAVRGLPQAARCNPQPESFFYNHCAQDKPESVQLLPTA